MAGLFFGIGHPASVAAAPPSWSPVRFETEENKTHSITHAIEVHADGRVVFAAGLDGAIAPSVAQAPAPLLAQLAAWVSKAKPGVASAASEYTLRVRITGRRPLVYAYGSFPTEVRTLVEGFGALINSPREPMPCASWDGVGKVTVTLWTQNYGVAAGPLRRTRVDGDGHATFAVGHGGPNAQVAIATKTEASHAERDAVRVAVRALDFSRFKDVFGGAGEGSDLRTVVVSTAGGTCARSFTNDFPSELKPLLDAMAPITRRLAVER